MMDMMHLIMPDQPQSFLGKFSDVTPERPRDSDCPWSAVPEASNVWLESEISGPYEWHHQL